MTIEQIKSELGYSTLNLNTSNDSNGVPTEWMRHWDNEARVAVSLHKELIAQLQADPSISDLAIQSELRDAPQGQYTAKRIVKYKASEVTL